MSPKPTSKNTDSASTTGLSVRLDIGGATSAELWLAMSQTPGIGVSITDALGRLLFVNNTTAALFSGDPTIDCQGKSIADFHPPAFVQERLELIKRVLTENKPLGISHIYKGISINSTIWPIRDRAPPYNRVLIVSRPGPTYECHVLVPNAIETFSTNYIDLGILNVLTRRELEVAVLVGHGLTVPQVADRLHRSPKTIERHKESISKKLRMRSQSQLVQVITLMGLELTHTTLERYPGSK